MTSSASVMDALGEVYDPELGWDNPRGRTSVNRACGQRTVTATYLDDRSRLTPGMTGEPALLAFGDSFTRGDGVDDDETYPAQLSRLLGRRVVNHGVGGYGPVQAVLKFRRRAPDYPGARTVLLGITHDDIYRMLNSYRPAYFPNSAGMFAFQPYMRGPVQHPNPNGPVPASFDDVLTLARRAFRDDYWALAEPRFPYTRALFDSLSRPPVWLRLLRRVDLSWVLRREEFRTALEALLGGFADSARSAGMTPIVLFMPQDAGERAVFDQVTLHLGQTLRGRAVQRLSRASSTTSSATTGCGSVGGSTSPDTGGPSIRSRERGRGGSGRAESPQESRWPPVRGHPRPTAYRARSSTRRVTAPQPAAPPGPRASSARDSVMVRDLHRRAPRRLVEPCVSLSGSGRGRQGLETRCDRRRRKDARP